MKRFISWLLLAAIGLGSAAQPLSAQAVAPAGCLTAPPNVCHDLGDAPDTVNGTGMTMWAYTSPALVQARFPTAYDPRLIAGYNPGPFHQNVPATPSMWYWLGPQVTHEVDAVPGYADMDPTNNLLPAGNGSDLDVYDDGLVSAGDIFSCANPRSLTFVLSSGAASPGRTVYVNAWMDFNRDGDWRDTVVRCGYSAVERIVRDYTVYMAPGAATLTVTVPYTGLSIGTGQSLWMRLTLANAPAPAPYDGSGPVGTYLFGETEDYLLR